MVSLEMNELLPTDCEDCECEDLDCDAYEDEDEVEDTFPTEYDLDTGLLFDNVQDTIDSLNIVLRNHVLDVEEVDAYSELLRQLYVVYQTVI